RRPVSVGLDGAVHLGRRRGGVRQVVSGPGRPGLRLPRAGAGAVLRRAGPRADGAAIAGHPDPAAGRRGSRLLGPEGPRLGDRLPVHRNGLRSRVVRRRDGGGHAPRARASPGKELIDAHSRSWVLWRPGRLRPGKKMRAKLKHSVFGTVRAFTTPVK